MEGALKGFAKVADVYAVAIGLASLRFNMRVELANLIGSAVAPLFWPSIGQLSIAHS